MTTCEALDDTGRVARLGDENDPTVSAAAVAGIASATTPTPA
jgi:hypothetical protein